MPKYPKIDGGYIVIPLSTLKSKQYQQLSNATKLVYQGFLMNFIRKTTTNPNNEVKITHRQLIKNSGVGHSSVVRGVRKLKQKGFIKVLVQGGLELNCSTYQLNRRYTLSGTQETYW